MRALIGLSLLLVAPPVWADDLIATSRVAAVTVYADAAEVVREVTVVLPAGRHSVTITDLPEGAVAEGLRIAAPDGVQLGAFALRAARLVPSAPVLTPEQDAAKAALVAARSGLATAQAGVDGLLAEVDAAEAQAAFLGRVTAEAGPETGPEALAAIADGIGAGVLAARQAAVAVRARLPEAEAARDDAAEAVVRAEAALAALAPAEAAVQHLVAALTAATAGEVTLTVTHFIEGASWRPVYDIALQRGEVPGLTVQRSALVTQYSGEDWRGVDLTLSTAQLSSQTEPGGLWPELRRIASPDDKARVFADAPAPAEMLAEVAMEPEVVAAAVTSDDLVIYQFPEAVDVATGVEDLRLALDSLSFAPEIEARAVPARDVTAFQMARFTNTSDEILLSGSAVLMRDGAVIGTAELARLAPGEDAELGFGAIEGLRLTAIYPTRAEGDAGFIVTSNRQEVTMRYTIENITEKPWTVRMLDAVSFAEQEDLEIEVTADPAPVETDVDDVPGLWAWSLEVAAGQTAEVALREVLTWPEGMSLE
jgi:uncharacterized protein (TIGR02231 family)